QNIVVVNDASTDHTRKIVDTLGVYLLDHLVNRGQGAALQTGTEFALKKGAAIIVHFDADGQMQAKDIYRIITPILDGQAEIVFGTRFLGKKSKIPWTKKYFILKPALIFNWFFTGIKLSDAHNGFRALSRQAANAIKITQDGMAHATEILDQVRAHDLNYTEVPVEIVYNQYGQRFLSGFKIIRDLIFAKITRK
ncbi:MAG: glycosyltransferase family 2 protein, partial [Candidatus Parcubacteria bacterium]|nr:glycosyltransferase family 2 protein [Candidatus Parcubacteria bacterium]